MHNIIRWGIRFLKSGEVVVDIEQEGLRRNCQLKPKDSEVVLRERGILVRHNGREVSCDFSLLYYRNPPTPLDRLLSGKTVERNHILLLLYEVISGVSRERCPILVHREPFSLQEVLAKYEGCGRHVRGIDFDALIRNIPDFWGTGGQPAW